MRTIVIGGGIAGLASALALTRRGWHVEVLERAPEFGEVGAGLSLWPNALRALDALGGGEQVRSRAVLGGQVGLAGHLKIGNHVSIGAQSGVMTNIPDGEKWLWTPAQPDRLAKRQMIALQQLPELIRRVAELEKKLGEDPSRPAK